MKKQKRRWYRGNIHTHTTESDGDAEPAEVIRWYREHGYDFLVLTDHNHLTLVDYGRDPRRSDDLLMIAGEELTLSVGDARVPVHLNGIGIERYVEPVAADDVLTTLQRNIEAILDAGGIASINHPTFKSAFDHEAIRQTRGASLLEIFNYDQNMHNYPVSLVTGTTLPTGLAGLLSPVEIWDQVLTAGVPLFGVAVDDSHHYHDFGPDKYNPGRGWVMVEAESLEGSAVVEALAAGNFYASTGIYLDDLDMSPDEISISARQKGNSIIVIRFIGRDGRIYAEQVGTEASYRPSGDEGYVRVWVWSSGGGEAWTQPLFLN